MTLIGEDPPDNPRFAAYAASFGRLPAEQLAYDDLHWPGGRMAGFVIWIQECWRAWRDLRGLPRDAILGESDHSAFDAWLRSGSYEADGARAGAGAGGPDREG